MGTAIKLGITGVILLILGVCVTLVYKWAKAHEGEAALLGVAGLFGAWSGASKSTKDKTMKALKLVAGGIKAAGATAVAGATSVATGAASAASAVAGAATTTGVATTAGVVAAPVLVIGGAFAAAKINRAKPILPMSKLGYDGDGGWVPTTYAQCGYSRSKSKDMHLPCPDSTYVLLNADDGTPAPLVAWRQFSKEQQKTYALQGLKTHKFLSSKSKDVKSCGLKFKFVGQCVKKGSQSKQVYSTEAFCGSGKPHKYGGPKTCSDPDYTWDTSSDMVMYRSIPSADQNKISSYYNTSTGKNKTKHKCGLRTKYVARCKKKTN